MHASSFHGIGFHILDCTLRARMLVATRTRHVLCRVLCADWALHVPRGRRMARGCRAPRKMRRIGAEVQYLCNSERSEVRVSNDWEERGRFRDSPGGYHRLLLHGHPITLQGEFGGKHRKVSPPFHSIPRHSTATCSESKPMNSYDRLLINMSAILKECRRGLELQKASANFAQQSSWTRKI